MRFAGPGRGLTAARDCLASEHVPHPLAGALRSLRVLDLSRVLAGPLCSMLLADYGADVLKIERPGVGDDTRAWGPPFSGSESAYFLCLNRGKRSLELDLNSSADRDRLRRLALRADVLIENFSVGWLAERGLGYADLSADHPGLVYCSISGWGQDGPDAELPGYDLLVQARAGLMSITGEVDGPPLKVGVAVSDLTAGLFACTAILAAIEARRATGLGQQIDVSLMDCQLAGLLNVASNFLIGGSIPLRHGNAHPNIVPYQLFSAADREFMLAVGNDGQWRRLCDLLEREAWKTDPRFSTNPARVARRAELIPVLEALFRTRPRDQWLELLRRADVPAGPVQNLAEVAADPQVTARGMLQHTVHPAAGPVTLVANPLLRGATTGLPPLLGEGGEDAEREWLAQGSASGRD